MALINCPKCGHTVSDRADKCPNCGVSLQTPENRIPQNGYQGQQSIVQSTYQQQSNYIPPCPKTWMVESILVTLFCCLPFGIAGIVNASKVSSSYAGGFYEEALNSSRNAGKWTKIGFWCGLALIIIYIIILIAAGAFASMNQ